MPREFYPGKYEHKENSDLRHGVCQALQDDKLHKTNIKDTTRSYLHARARQRNRTANVQSIGRHDSSGLPFMTRLMRTSRILAGALVPFLSLARPADEGSSSSIQT